MENSPAGLNGPLSARDVGIRSYVIRSGRMTDMQKDALVSLYARYGIDWEPSRILDSSSIIGHEAPLVVEIGFGMGTATAAIAEALPGTAFLGLEVHAPGVGKLLSEIDARAIANLRVCRHDAVEVVDAMLAPASVDGFHVFFPDPWPKKRHHKRRIMNPDFVRLLANRLKVGGYLYYVTDWEEYAEATLAVLSAEFSLSNTGERWAERMPWRPVTKFEQRALNDGRPVRELLFIKK
ncbi:MAG: tRNA (guanosine(46)-N7)-methyltransferase TrmB [Spirochaetes bacterium GWB1_59_5]|nr:MAG: tRNA (guanosine(46)-N7)-methyltransferase TrmB [Spirochaetes bacterium GWB1_59_5]